MNPIVAKFISTLLASRTQAHIFHWQVQDASSYAQHKALNDYYDEIVELTDELVESLQGKYGIIRGYVSPAVFREDGNPLIYFKALSQYIETNRASMPQDSYIQNQIDEILALVESTIYKLENLH